LQIRVGWGYSLPHSDGSPDVGRPGTSRGEVLSSFGGLYDFIEYRNYLQDEESIKRLNFEDD